MHDVPKRFVIVGGGFAGVTLAQHLEQLLPPAMEVLVLSDANHLVFTPMLPEVVGRTISPLHIVVAGRQMTRRTKWLEARVSKIDLENSEVHYTRGDGSEGSMPYTHLVLACGSVSNLDEIPGLASWGYPLKTVIHAITIGNDLIGNFEAAAVNPETKVRQRLLTTVVIGGGFSGVELAGHIADLMHAIRRFYPELKNEIPRVVMLQRSGRILPELNHQSLSEFALAKLQENGVEVRLHTEAREVTSDTVSLASGEKIETGMTICTVGTAPCPLVAALGLPLERGRLKTDSHMKVIGTNNLWGLGDCSLIPNAYDGHPSPATAQFAVRQAKQLAENLASAAQGQALKPFCYRPRGMFASIGHRNAVAEIYGVKLSGFIAWFLWRGVYLSKLPTLSRKIEVALNWALSIPFPPNIVQFRMPIRPSTEAGNKNGVKKTL